MGFGVPIDYWLKGPLKDWAQELLSYKALKDYLNVDLVNKHWKDYIERGFRWHFLIWTVLMFSAWLSEWER